MTPPVTVADFKAQFVREFDYGARKDQVLDADITRALNDTGIVFNPNLWADDTEQNIAYLYASAHFLVLNVQNAGGLSLENNSAGINSKGTAAIIAKSVGQVSLNFQFPEWVMNSPILSGFLTTGFGQRYLQLLTPRCVGAGYTVFGWSDVAGAGAGGINVANQELFPTGNFDIDPTISPVEYMFYVMGTNEVSARILLARSGRIKALLVKAGANTLDGETIISLMRNGSIQILSTTLAAGQLFNQDVIHEIPVNGTDEISIKVDLSASTSGFLTALRATVIYQP
jgi:hypothetical protein